MKLRSISLSHLRLTKKSYDRWWKLHNRKLLNPWSLMTTWISHLIRRASIWAGLTCLRQPFSLVWRLECLQMDRFIKKNSSLLGQFRPWLLTKLRSSLVLPGPAKKCVMSHLAAGGTVATMMISLRMTARTKSMMNQLSQFKPESRILDLAMRLFMAARMAWQSSLSRHQARNNRFRKWRQSSKTLMMTITRCQVMKRMAKLPFDLTGKLEYY